MSDQPPQERFKTEMPDVPGVGESSRPPASGNPAGKLVIGVLAVLLVFIGVAHWALRPRHVEPRPAEQQQPRIEVPAPAPDPSTLIPHATEADPRIADVSEMAKPWSSKDFIIRNRLSGESVPALLIRLPMGSPAQPNGYWGFAKNSPYGDCQLEYITDLNKLKNDYGFKGAKHPMVGNPCTQTLFDPLKITNLPGNIWVRGAIAQGSDLRPPFGVEIRINGKRIEAMRTE